MTIYITNPSKQHATLYYRTPDNLLANVDIPSGGQVMIGTGWPKEAIEKLVEHLVRFGSREASETNGQLVKFTGMLFRRDKVITEDEIVAGHEAIVANQEERSVVEATRAALAFDKNANQKGKNRQRLARVTQVEVRQELGPNERPTGNEVNFDLTIDPENGRSDVLQRV